MYRTSIGLSAALATAVAANAPAESADGRWFFSTGVEYSTGDYGETRDTTTTAVPLSAGYVAERWSAVIAVPVVHISGPGTIVPGGLDSGGPFGGLFGATPASAVTSTKDVDTTGIGDVSLTLSGIPFVMEGGTQFLIVSRIRVPTGDVDRALGTGEWAAALSGGVRQPLGRGADIFATVGYEQALEANGGGVVATCGAESYLAERVQVGASLNYAQASSTLLRDGAQAGAFVGYDLSGTTRVQAYGAAGLSETSPNVAAGLRIVFSSD